MQDERIPHELDAERLGQLYTIARESLTYVVHESSANSTSFNTGDISIVIGMMTANFINFLSKQHQSGYSRNPDLVYKFLEDVKSATESALLYHKWESKEIKLIKH